METLQTTLLGAAVTLGCTVLVVFRVATAPAPTPLRAATTQERAEIAQAIAASESAWTSETTQNFPADSWSQRDDFSGREYRKAQDLSKEKNVRLEDILRAVDDDIHRSRGSRTVNGTVVLSPERHADAVPCKPRPFYD